MAPVEIAAIVAFSLFSILVFVLFLVVIRLIRSKSVQNLATAIKSVTKESAYIGLREGIGQNEANVRVVDGKAQDAYDKAYQVEQALKAYKAQEARRDAKAEKEHEVRMQEMDTKLQMLQHYGQQRRQLPPAYPVPPTPYQQQQQHGYNLFEQPGDGQL